MGQPGLMDALRAGQRLLQSRASESARLECEMLLSHILGCQRHELYIRGNELLSREQLSAFRSMLDRRRKGEPIQYILGSREFMGLPFHVDDRVLIPRWETEILVEWLLNHWKSVPGPVHLLDLGTGSGAIAVSLAFYLPASRITAVDIREEALLAARENAVQNGVADRIRFLQGDLFCALEGPGGKDRFDGIVSNPPYIPTGEIGGLMTEVRDYEPRVALDGGEDGLGYYRRIARAASPFLNRDGLVAVEMGYGQSPQVQDIFLQTGNYTLGGIRKDLAGMERVAIFLKRQGESNV